MAWDERSNPLISPRDQRTGEAPVQDLRPRRLNRSVSAWTLVASLVGLAAIGGYLLYRSLSSSARPNLARAAASRYPASFYTGPAGRNILLPQTNGYPAKRAWIGEEKDAWPKAMLSRERYIGRKFNIYSYYSQGHCDDYPAIAREAVAHGWIPMISWFPTPANANEIISGASDRCIERFARSVASGRTRVFVRPYWEFNSGSYAFSFDSNGKRASASQEQRMWQHTVDVIHRNASAAAKITFVWCPDEGYFNNGDAWNHPTPYPGGQYVDWVCSDGYNWNSPDAYCGQHAGWCSFSEVFTHGRFAPAYRPTGVERHFRGSKPYMVGETASVEDRSAPGRKGQWMIDMQAYIKSHMPGLYAVVYFDSNYNNDGMQLDTSPSSLAGYKSLANDLYFTVSTWPSGSKRPVRRKT